MATPDVSKQDYTSSSFSGNLFGQTNPQTAPKTLKSIKAFGRDLIVFQDAQNRAYVWVDNKQVYLDDPLFGAKENAYQDLLQKKDNLEASVNSQVESHMKWYNFWTEKFNLAKESYEKAVPVEIFNNRKFNETLAHAGCSYLELGQKTDQESKDLYAEAVEYRGLELGARRTKNRSVSEMNSDMWLAFDEKKWANHYEAMKSQINNIFERLG